MKRLLVIILVMFALVGCQDFGKRVDVDYETVSNNIKEYLLENEYSEYKDIFIQNEIIGVHEKEDNYIVYMRFNFNTYQFVNNELQMNEGAAFPMVFTLDNEFNIISYEKPREFGSEYIEDVNRMFPKKYVDIALGDEETIYSDKSIKLQVLDYYNIHKYLNVYEEVILNMGYSYKHDMFIKDIDGSTDIRIMENQPEIILYIMNFDYFEEHSQVIGTYKYELNKLEVAIQRMTGSSDTGAPEYSVTKVTYDTQYLRFITDIEDFYLTDNEKQEIIDLVYSMILEETEGLIE